MQLSKDADPRRGMRCPPFQAGASKCTTILHLVNRHYYVMEGPSSGKSTGRGFCFRKSFLAWELKEGNITWCYLNVYLPSRAVQVPRASFFFFNWCIVDLQCCGFRYINLKKNIFFKFFLTVGYYRILCRVPWAVFSSISRSVMSSTLRPHGLQHARPPCPPPTPGVRSNSCPLSQWCHPTISSSVVPLSSHRQSFPAWGSFQMSQLFASGGQSIEVWASASVLPMNTQDWHPFWNEKPKGKSESAEDKICKCGRTV